MKALFLAAAALALVGCGEREQSSDNGIAADEGFSVENSAGNDVTAIDAATADAAGMAADSEANLALDNLALDNFGNEADGNTPATVAANEE